MNMIFNENNKTFITVCHLQSNCNLVELCKIMCEFFFVLFIKDKIKDSNEIGPSVMEITLKIILEELSMCCIIVF